MAKTELQPYHEPPTGLAMAAALRSARSMAILGNQLTDLVLLAAADRSKRAVVDVAVVEARAASLFARSSSRRASRQGAKGRG